MAFAISLIVTGVLGVWLAGGAGGVAGILGKVCADISKGVCSEVAFKMQVIYVNYKRKEFVCFDCVAEGNV